MFSERAQVFKLCPTHFPGGRKFSRGLRPRASLVTGLVWNTLILGIQSLQLQPYFVLRVLFVCVIAKFAECMEKRVKPRTCFPYIT